MNATDADPESTALFPWGTISVRGAFTEGCDAGTTGCSTTPNDVDTGTLEVIGDCVRVAAVAGIAGRFNSGNSLGKGATDGASVWTVETSGFELQATGSGVKDVGLGAEEILGATILA